MTALLLERLWLHGIGVFLIAFAALAYAFIGLFTAYRRANASAVYGDES